MPQQTLSHAIQSSFIWNLRLGPTHICSWATHACFDCIWLWLTSECNKHLFWRQLTFWHNMVVFCCTRKGFLICNSASLAWHVHKHKDRVSHQCPPAAEGQRHVSRVWTLGTHFKDLRPLGGWRGPAGHNCPEEKALSWADESTVTAPHRAGKRFPLSSLFLRQALQRWTGWGQVWGSSWGVWRRGRWSN